MKMNKDNFFEKIYDNATNDTEVVINLLKARGFLLYKNGKQYYMSDNGHVFDERYLDVLLKKYEIGYVNNREILITKPNNAYLFQEEFEREKVIEGGSCINQRDWRYFKRRQHGEKAAVSWLEPFIARYIKAISACCVLTIGSCDGNHSGKRKMYIITEGDSSISWHKLICEKCLINKFDINWANDFTEMRFKPETQYRTYYELNMAAEYLYENRIRIRQIKDDAFKDISERYLKTHTPEEIEKEFIGRAATLFETWN